MRGYTEYQKKYSVNMRESDKRLIEIVRRLVGDAPKTLVDIGCSTGNLLLHMRRLLPRLRLVGGELAAQALALCRANPDLAGIRLEEMNLARLDRRAEFDIAVVNAVLYLFDRREFEAAVSEVAKALRPGGALVAFDWFHPWEQELEIKESSETHPNGLMIHLRPYSQVREILTRSGFAEVSFEPFEIPIDLPRPDRPGDMLSYTTRTAAGGRIILRGSLAQPWCFLVARKA